MLTKVLSPQGGDSDFELLPLQAALHIQIKQVEGSNQRRPQYVFRDLDGNPISKAQAKAIIQAKWGDAKY